MMKIYHLLLFLFFFIPGCKKENGSTGTPPPTPLTLPTVKTTDIFSITPLTASAGGEVTKNGGANVTSRGFCWGTTSNPVISGNHTTVGSGDGTFSSSLPGLTPGTLYYVRAFATNSVGTAYGNELSFTTATPDVYTAGYETNSNSYTVAKVWKNGTETALSPPTIQGWAKALYVSGADVHVAGYEFNGVRLYAKGWKNGATLFSTNGNYDAQAFAISGFGSDVYIAGYEKNSNGKAVAKIWKNGVSTSLTDGTNEAQAYGIFVTATDVYAVGFETISGSSRAKLWKNGVGFTLGGINQTAYAVYVSGSDVYVAGGEITPAGYAKAVLWKNEVPNYLTNGISSIAIAYSVYVDASDVYVAGFDQSTGTGLAKAMIWKNGVPNALTNGSNYARANSLYVYNHDVYVTGYEMLSPYTVSRTWKNGILIHSSAGTSNASSSFLLVK